MNFQNPAFAKASFFGGELPWLNPPIFRSLLLPWVRRPKCPVVCWRKPWPCLSKICQGRGSQWNYYKKALQIGDKKKQQKPWNPGLDMTRMCVLRQGWERMVKMVSKFPINGLVFVRKNLPESLLLVPKYLGFGLKRPSLKSGLGPASLTLD